MSSSNSKISEPLASPCVRRCCLDDGEQCLGCGRLLSEILEWGRADDQRRLQIREVAQARLRARQDGL